MGRAALHKGMRTCVGCRRRLPPDQLLRLNFREGALVCVPPGRPRVGRGASVCPDPSCLDKALRKGALERALRLPHGTLKDVSAHKVLAEALIAYKTRLDEILRSGGPEHDKVAESVSRMVHAMEEALSSYGAPADGN